MANYNGRYVAGQLYYQTAPEPGTILGPNGFGELLVVLGSEDGITYLGLATQPEVDAARGNARSLTELRLR